MRAYLIDPDTATITVVELPEANDPGHLAAIYKHLGCSTIEAVRLDQGKYHPCDVVYLDEEGLFKGPKRGFGLLGHPQQFYVGKGLVCGTTQEGDTKDPDVSLTEVQHRLTGWSIPVA